MRIIEKKASGTWWKVLLGFISGVIFGVAGVVIGVVGAGAYLRTGDIVSMTGADPNVVLTPEWQDKTPVDIVMEAVGGNIKIETLGDIAKITPLVDSYVTNLSDQLNELGCELTKEEVFSWPLTELSDNLIESVKKVELINFLSKDKADNPDPVIKYLCYQTDDEGNYVVDDEGKLIPQTLMDMLENSSFIQTKVDSMKIKVLFSEEEISKSNLLNAIKDKTVKELSKDGAFDDVKISDVINSKDSSKIVKALAREEVTIGKIGDGVNNLYLDDVFEYSNYDSLPAVLKKLLAKDSFTAIPGTKLIANPFTITKMVINPSTKYVTEYDYIVISDGQIKEGVKPSEARVSDLVNKTDYIKLSEVAKNSSGEKVERGFDTVTITKKVGADDKVSWTATTSGEIDRPFNLETIDVNIYGPAEWAGNIYVYACNKPARVKELDSSIDDLKLKDVIKIKTDDALWKVRNEEVNNGDDLFTSIRENLTIADIITNKDEIKFLNKIDDNTTIENIGNAVNDLSLLDAFDENIYDSAGNLNIKWKYLLVDSTEWKEFNSRFLPGTPINRDDDPFKQTAYEIEMAKPEADRDPSQYMKCNEYTVGGTGNKGIDQLIDNMTNNMKTATIRELDGDGMASVAPGFIDTTIPVYYAKQADFALEGKVTYGDLTLTEFTELVSAGITTP